MTIIEAIELRTILDSRGNATVEADIHTSGGFGRSAAPSGASTGTLEATVRPPKEAIENAYQNLLPALIGLDASDQEGFDEQLRTLTGLTTSPRSVPMLPSHSRLRTQKPLLPQ